MAERMIMTDSADVIGWHNGCNCPSNTTPPVFRVLNTHNCDTYEMIL
jgi:hypothetical protein